MPIFASCRESILIFIKHDVRQNVAVRVEAVYFCTITMLLTHYRSSVCVATWEAKSVCLIWRATCNLPYRVTCVIIGSYPIRSQVCFLGSLPEINLHHNALLLPPFLYLLPSFFTLLTIREVETSPPTFPILYGFNTAPRAVPTHKYPITCQHPDTLISELRTGLANCAPSAQTHN